MASTRSRKKTKPTAACPVVMDTGRPCGKDVRCWNLCDKHYQRLRRGCSPEEMAATSLRRRTPCRIVEQATGVLCPRLQKGLGMCSVHLSRFHQGWPEEDLGLPPHARRKQAQRGDDRSPVDKKDQSSRYGAVEPVVLDGFAAIDADIMAFITSYEDRAGITAARQVAVRQYEQWCQEVGLTPFEHTATALAAFVRWLTQPTGDRPGFTSETMVRKLKVISDEFRRRTGDDPHQLPVLAEAVEAAKQQSRPLAHGDREGRAGRAGPVDPFGLAEMGRLVGTCPGVHDDVIALRALWRIAGVVGWENLETAEVLSVDAHRVEVISLGTVHGLPLGSTERWHAPWLSPAASIAAAVAAFGTGRPIDTWPGPQNVEGIRRQVEQRFLEHGRIDHVAYGDVAPSDFRMAAALDPPYLTWLRTRAGMLVAWRSALALSEARQLQFGVNVTLDQRGWQVVPPRRRTRANLHPRPQGLMPATDPVLCATTALDEWLDAGAMQFGDHLLCAAPLDRLDRTAPSRGRSERNQLRAMLAAAELDRRLYTWRSFRLGYEALAQGDATSAQIATATGSTDLAQPRTDVRRRKDNDGEQAT